MRERTANMKKIRTPFIIVSLIALLLSACTPENKSGSAFSENKGSGSSSIYSETEQSSKEISIVSKTTASESGNQPDSSEINSKSSSPVASVHSSAPSKSTVSSPIKPTAAPARQYYQSEIGMWYCVWWDSEEMDSYFYEHHWLAETRVKPARFGYYATDDTKKLEYDFNYFNKIGVDYLILDDTNNHMADSGNIASHINTCFKVANNMGVSKAVRLSFAGGNPLLNNNLEGMQAEMDIFAGYAAKYPNLYYNWKGKPLFVNFNTPVNFKFTDTKNRFTIRNSCGHTSEALGYAAKYNLNTNGLFGWVFDIQFDGSDVFGINPGWSRSHNGLQSGAAPKSRENGEKFTKMWLDAVKTKPKTIVIASWNDHAEETGIEAVNLKEAIPGRENESKNPYMYEQLTEGYLALKTGYLEGFYYRAEHESQVYNYSGKALNKVSAVPDNKVVIVIPDDYYSWAGVQRK